MSNLYDLIDSIVPPPRIVKYICTQSHTFNGDNPPRICPECDHVWAYRVIDDRQFSIAKSLDSMLGSSCQCCGSRKRLQVDHIFGKRSKKYKKQYPTLKDIYSSPQDFQRLCRDCNRWKNDGPCCPCRYWDATFSGWRDSGLYGRDVEVEEGSR